MVPDIVIRFRLDTRTLSCGYRKVPLNTWSDLKQQLGFTPKTLLDALGDWDLDALGALVWLERRQRERTLRWHDVRHELSTEEHDVEIVGMAIDGRWVLGEADDTADDTADGADPTTGSG